MGPRPQSRQPGRSLWRKMDTVRGGEDRNEAGKRVGLGSVVRSEASIGNCMDSEDKCLFHGWLISLELTPTVITSHVCIE